MKNIEITIKGIEGQDLSTIGTIISLALMREGVQSIATSITSNLTEQENEELHTKLTDIESSEVLQGIVQEVNITSQIQNLDYKGNVIKETPQHLKLSVIMSVEGVRSLEEGISKDFNVLCYSDITQKVNTIGKISITSEEWRELSGDRDLILMNKIKTKEVQFY